MKLQFKEQGYQLAAVASVVDVFEGQPRVEGLQYQVDPGSRAGLDMDAAGVRNADIARDVASRLLARVQAVQGRNRVARSEVLHSKLGACQLDVEMETGTGKTYVYTQTIFELNRLYGWSKFIIIVPSVAIREGVRKSLSMTEQHFHSLYGKKLRHFVYDSKHLQKIDEFARDTQIGVMIINMQAFNREMGKEGGSRDALIIHSRQDSFSSRRPIDVIASTRPILILDEPQKMEGRKTQGAMQTFNPLFSINYSATHRTAHNLVYVLDALDAYNQRLVKKIEVVGFELRNILGTSAYLYLSDIIISTDRPPCAKIEMEVREAHGIRRRVKSFSSRDDLYHTSGQLEAYRGLAIKDIWYDPDAPERSGVEFTNGSTLFLKQTCGDVESKHKARIQIRETIAAHLRKEEELFRQGVKCLSLFFLDEVRNYRRYDEAGQAQLGEYGEMFEQEYRAARDEKLRSLILDPAYRAYLERDAIAAIHAGYFSVDRKGRAIDSKEKRGAEGSDDVSAYDLILKSKERLLSLDEPVRFIFSHSALREGWDNPNVFQICSFHQSQSSTRKRQEVGRGLRLCVDAKGERLDSAVLGREGVHRLNRLTVVAAESYAAFATELQKDLKENLYTRPQVVTVKGLEGLTVCAEGEEPYVLDETQAQEVYLELRTKGYIDAKGEPTPTYHAARREGTLLPIEGLTSEVSEAVYRHVERIATGAKLEDLVENAVKPDIHNQLNGNFHKREFQELWKRIHHHSSYRVSFDSEELIAKCIAAIDRELQVPRLEYQVRRGEQKETLSQEEVRTGEMLTLLESEMVHLEGAPVSEVRYDLLGEIARPTCSRRLTVARILMGIREEKFAMYPQNPERFIQEVRRILTEQRATLIVDHISYNLLKDTYDSSIFTEEKHEVTARAHRGDKSVTDYVFTDSAVEQHFATELDAAREVVAYAKLPRGFQIPTPLGDYSPDWAIAFDEGAVKHVYFVAETKGSMSSLDLRGVEEEKIKCARRLFAKISNGEVKYEVVSGYQALRDVLGGRG
ncbi:MAG: restriction endonuclease subunit R [Bacteroidia bacterium]|nr:MAG: restriction endonuclease subunit R [Bacteroidia bacterium]